MGRYKARINKRTRMDAARRRGERRGPKTAEILIGHAISRARIRYGQRLRPTDIQIMNGLIQSESGKFMGKDTSKRSKWVIEYMGVTYAAIYNKALHSIVTFLPKEVLDEWEVTVEA